MNNNKTFILVALATGLLLLIPFSLMSFKIPLYDPGSGYEMINWTLFDFVVMGGLIFSTGSMFVLATRIFKQKYWVFLGVALAIAFLWLWAELAVGIFTNWGS